MSRKSKSRRQQGAPRPGRHVPAVQASAPRWLLWLLPALIALVTLAAFEPTLHNQFVTGWDDNRNLLDNPHYRGLGGPQLHWMFTAFHVGHYMPLTWMTLGLDYVIWGMQPAGYHLTSLLLHAASAVLLYFVAARLLAAALPAVAQQSPTALALSAAAAALVFALHPLRVESVAWATERRDVLSGFFYLSATLTYLAFCQREARRWGWYATSLALFACALLSKSIAVSLPVVLLILDAYPLRRVGASAGWSSSRAWRVYFEKLPFFVLAGAMSAVAFQALFQIRNMAPLSQIGLGERLAISAYSLGFYLWKTLAPVQLSPLYELTGVINPWAPTYLLSYLVVGAITALAISLRRRVPGLAAAWLAYIVILLPVLGIFQNGPQISADRYTYLACVGWALLAAGGLLTWWRRAPLVAAGLVAGILLALGTLTWNQVPVWHEPETLWRHAIAVGPRSPVARNNLGVALASRKKLAEAIIQYQEAARLKPNYAEAHYNWGVTLADQGKLAEAISHYQEALRLRPDYADAHNNWGVALARQGQFAEAVTHFERAVRLRPDHAEAYNNWGLALADQRQFADAIERYQQAIRLKPDYADPHFNWANALASQGRVADAIAQYQEAIRIRPDYAEAHNNWGLALARQGQLAGAIAHYRQAVTIRPGLAEAYNNWGLALASEGQFADAITRYEQAVRIRPDFAQAHYNWSVALAKQGRTSEASERLQQAQRLKP
jgi:tetratricopeptide (TPR) repeat protein